MTIDKSTVTVDGDILKAKITKEKIPKNGNAGAFGYGLLIDGTNNVLVLASHLCASDSEVQTNAPDRICPDPVGISILVDDFSEHDGANFHAHVLDLKPAETDCTNTYVDEAPALEVDFASTVNTGNNVSPDWIVKAIGKHILVGNVETSDLNDTGVEAVVSFNILPIVDGNEITNLCIDLIG